MCVSVCVCVYHVLTCNLNRCNGCTICLPTLGDKRCNRHAARFGSLVTKCPVMTKHAATWALTDCRAVTIDLHCQLQTTGVRTPCSRLYVSLTCTYFTVAVRYFSLRINPRGRRQPKIWERLCQLVVFQTKHKKSKKSCGNLYAITCLLLTGVCFILSQCVWV